MPKVNGSVMTMAVWTEIPGMQPVRMPKNEPMKTSNRMVGSVSTLKLCTTACR